MVVKTEDTDFEPVETMDLGMGDLCLDFANTAGGRTRGPFRDKLGGYGDLVTWAERVELLGPQTGRRLREAARRSPEEATIVLERARGLREAIYRLFVRAPGADAERATVDADADARLSDDLALLEEESATAWAQRRLIAEGDGYRFDWPESGRLDQPLWPVVMAAVELLTSEERRRVKSCASDTCDWLFVDMSRNRSRRWCDMSVCGNRAKARRFSAKHKGKGSA
jgi:predicted RNA-binding Zn ribbon-like protein